MPALFRRIFAAALLTAAAPTALAAQEHDALVLPPGVVRLRFGGIYSGYDARFGTAGDREQPGAALGSPLDATRFAPLAPLQSDLQRFFAGSGTAVGAETLTLGTPAVRVYDNVTRAPLSLSVGLVPRLEVGVALPIVRGERLVERLSFAGGTVGVNPDTAANRAAFRRIGGEWEALGRNPLLPTDSSALGRALQARARAAGAVLQLPEGPIAAADFNALLQREFGVRPLTSTVEEWRTGDVEVSVSALLFSSFGTRPFPADSARLGFRTSVSAALHVPTGSRPDSALLIPLETGEGHGGPAARIAADLFVGRRFWGTAALRWRGHGEGEVARRAAGEGALLATRGTVETVGLTPGDEIELTIAPRYRLAEAISLGATYQLLHVGEPTISGSSSAGVLLDAAGAAHRVGLSGRYSTLPGYARGTTGIPAEARLAWDVALAGPAGHPASSRISAEVSVLPRLWGRR